MEKRQQCLAEIMPKREREGQGEGQCKQLQQALSGDLHKNANGKQRFVSGQKRLRFCVQDASAHCLSQCCLTAKAEARQCWEEERERAS